MDTGLAGRVAIITGGSRGIGAATALALVREGAAVTLTSRKQEALDVVAAERLVLCRRSGLMVVGLSLRLLCGLSLLLL